MKNILLFVLLFASAGMSAQEKMSTKTGKITFEATVPSFEEVKAKSENATCVLNAATGEIAALVMMKSFRFKIALMEEHFNENYVHSDKYPKATFRGKIENFKPENLTSSFQEYTLRGKLELHGKTRDILASGKMKKTDKGVEIIVNFKIKTDDYDIEIPKVVNNKVSKTVAVTGDFIVK